MDIISAAIMLALVIDPIGNVPVYLSALSNVEPARQRYVVVRELLIAYAILVLFMFLGQHVLALMHISDPALTIAGGVVLFLIALRMVFPTSERSGREEIDGEPFIVPLAIPYVAGPSALATVMLLMSREPSRWVQWWIALTLAWLASAAVLVAGSSLRRWLGRRGLVAMERLMGMVLVAVAVQMFLDGIGMAFDLKGDAAQATVEEAVRLYTSA
jgi:MarC family membrane protein